MINLYIVTPRFNPAYAGNIHIINSLSNNFQVQPRVCGEYCTASTIFSTRSGSTPRMRGISFIMATTIKIHRFNPAYAGNIAARLRVRAQGKVQPRVCGEYCRLYWQNESLLGSTPRMRGISPSACCSGTHSQVQPRVCGEYLISILLVPILSGSTPRMRGIY